ncbi:MAG TPA: hypothetical protein VF121_12280, partial [Thermoanaerobaculia bacterium]|nr:hypothetical protein [Thermoanaerobaculia bacterium]
MAAVPARLAVALGLLWYLLQHAPAAPVAAPAAAGHRAADGRSLISEHSPEAMEELLARRPSLVEPHLTHLADALAASDAALAGDAAEFLARMARARVRRLGAAPPDADIDALLTLLLVHPGRFAHDPPFRGRVVAFWPRVVDAADPPPAALRGRLLTEINRLEGFDFEASERVEAAWGMVPRASVERRHEPPGPFTVDDDLSRPIEASIYSLPSDLIDAASAARLLGAVRALDPRRELLVMTDQPAPPAEASGGRLAWEVLPTFGRLFSPWPRDPLSVVRRPDGGVMVLLRPNVQRQREEDAFLGRELVQTLPERVDRAWKGVTWSAAPVPFHNGQVLITPEASWVSLHAFELRALELLGLPRVPVERFGGAAGVDRYVAAVEHAAAELGALYGRPVRFVHPLPSERPAAERPRLMARLGGGAGHDLDSLLTFLPGRRTTALVADLTAGRALLAAAPAAEWTGFRAGYGLAPAAERLPAELAAALDTPAAAGLDGFLDLVAEHLRRRGMAVERLPLLLVPTRLLAKQEALRHDRFAITWNNVVVETREGKVRAEGFASLLPAGDRLAEEAFARAGTRLDLLPPLVRSIVLTGGYRCASNHLRG